MRKAIFALSLLFLSFLAPSPASAQSFPGACFTYGFTDGFETTSALWAPWSGSPHGVITVGNIGGSAHAGSFGVLMSLGRTDPIGSFLVIDRDINVNQTTTRSRLSAGCTVHPPFPPLPVTAPPLYCVASVWVNPAGIGASGAIQLLEPGSYMYLSTTATFNLPASAPWTHVVGSPSTTCRRDMIVRVVLNRDSTSSTDAAFDDVGVDFYY